MRISFLPLYFILALIFCACGSDEPDYPNAAKRNGDFYEFNNLRYTLKGNNATVEGFIEDASSLDIPSKITIVVNKEPVDYPVTEIAPSAFEYSKLSRASFPNTLLTIGNNAFYNTSLRQLNVPNSVTTIGSGAFSMSSDIEKVVIGTGISSIGERAFYLATGIEVFIFKGATPPSCGRSALNFERKASLPLSIYVPDGTIDAYAPVLGYINGYYATHWLKELSTYNGAY